MLLLSVLSWRVSQAWNPHQLKLSPGTWSLWLSQASVQSLWSLCWCHWCYYNSRCIKINAGPRTLLQSPVFETSNLLLPMYIEMDLAYQRRDNYLGFWHFSTIVLRCVVSSVLSQSFLAHRHDNGHASVIWPAASTRPINRVINYVSCPWVTLGGLRRPQRPAECVWSSTQLLYVQTGRDRINWSAIGFQS